MWAPGEIVKHSSTASCNKEEGTLYFTNKRIVWCKKDAQIPTISITHDDFLAQQVSKIDAKKVMLRITVAEHGAQSGASATRTYTFTWRSMSRDMALANRDKYVTELSVITNRRAQVSGANSDAAVTANTNQQTQQNNNGQNDSNAQTQDAAGDNIPLLSEFGNVKIGAVPASAEEIKLRQAVLTKNSDISELHKSLVLNGLISEDEFWSTRKHILESQEIQQLLRKGDSSSWLDLAPTTQDGGNFKYTITPDVAKRIFKEYPQVRRAYINNVPHKVGEKQFWKRFLASRFFNRNRSTTAMKGNPDSIFDECLREEDAMLSDSKRMNPSFILRLLDLTRTAEDSVETGNAPDFTMRPGRFAESLSLIRRFNRHSELVLHSAINSKRMQPSMDSSTIDRELSDATVINDLSHVPKAKKIKLDIQDQSRYFTSVSKSDSATPSQTSQSGRPSNGPQSQLVLGAGFDLSRPLSSCGDPQYTMQVLSKSIRSAAMQSQPNRINDIGIPEELKKAIKECHGAGSEMLRHLWSIMRLPVTPKRSEKAKKIVEAFKDVRTRVRETIIQANATKSANSSLGNIIERIVKPVADSLDIGEKEYQKRFAMAKS